MKKIMIVLVAIVSFISNAMAQDCSDDLLKYCSVYNSTKLIIGNSSDEEVKNLEMSEYKKDIDGETFATEISLLYEWNHIDIPLCKVASTIWVLVSKQIHGEKGLLTLSKINFLPTRDEKGRAILAIILWDKSKGKWAILSLPLMDVRTRILRKGSRMFANS